MNFKKAVIAASATLALSVLSVAAHANVVNLDAKVQGVQTTEFFIGGVTYDVSWVGISQGGAYDSWAAATGTTGPAKFRNTFYASEDGTAFTGTSSDTGAVIGSFNNAGVAFTSYADALAYGQAHPLTVTFATDTTVSLSINDYLFTDNSGGVSLSVTQAVPEPETYALMLAGLGAIGFVGRRRSGKAV